MRQLVSDYALESMVVADTPQAILFEPKNALNGAYREVLEAVSMWVQMFSMSQLLILLQRMGMAYLQGQLNIQQNPTIAMPLLQHAAYLSSIEVPQPAYVYALLLVQEFPHVTLPQQLLQSLVPQSHPPPISNPSVPPPTLMSESRKYLERSAYLNFGPALYKLGQSYEHALPPFPYDPLMSVQYYSLASQTGNALADLALSKWFLVGSKPDPADPTASAESFEKDESLALVFAEKAAMKGEAGGEFAMGYYCEVGIGRKQDMNEAKR